MALTLRLSDKESKTLKRILPDYSTFSGKLKHMIMTWGFQQNEIHNLRRKLEEEQRKKDQYAARLSEVQNALKVLKSLSDRGF
jgi:septal ring factor EnvC (AmiA/AmiB activator)